MADVPVGAANAKPWQRHIEFLKQLSDVMSRIGEPIVVEGCEKPGIDHIAISAQLQATQVGGWPKDVTGNRLSDHDGVWAEIT
ncbi:MAG: endonuclease/exonuclease/phosphatase family metal-dependent hydrolase [Candidatus Poriferisodalaceae bacterium]|jgi:endonuclease/exonuclease/phosphatase family metal-dependent hydrolase